MAANPTEALEELIKMPGQLVLHQGKLMLLLMLCLHLHHAYTLSVCDIRPCDLCIHALAKLVSKASAAVMLFELQE